MNSGYARCAVAQSLQLSLPQKLAIDGDWLMMRSGRAHWGVMMRRYGMGWLLGLCLIGAAAVTWYCWPQPVVERPLVIWSGRNIPELNALGREFTARTGRAVRVETPGNFVEKFEILAQQGQGPDIIIWAHDRFAAWAQAGLLESIPTSALPQGHCLPEAAAPLREADRLLGYPLQLESLVLFWNRALMSSAPRDDGEFAHLASTLPKGVDLLGWDLSSPYHSWPFVSAGVTRGLWVDEQQRLRLHADQPRVVANMQRLADWIRYGWMPHGLSYELALDRFSQGKLAMMVGGPWDAHRLDQSGVDYGVAGLPALAGRAVHPFYGVMAAGISSHSSEKLLAREFIEQSLLTAKGMALYQADVETGLVACYGQPQALNARRQAILQSVRQGVAMPSHPAMPLFWNSSTAALNNYFTGRQSAQEAWQEAELRVNQPPQKGS